MRLHATLEPVLHELVAFLQAQGVTAWLIGGAVRDLVRGQVPGDLDLALTGDGFELARAYADARGAAFVPLDQERATGRVVIAGEPALTLDLAALRGPSIEADLRLRDFTINALALPLGVADAVLLDPTGGLVDLEAGVLRACGPDSLRDDPLRVLRAARLCANLDLRPEAKLTQLISAAAPELAVVAAERIREELLKLLVAPTAATWLRYLDTCGALTSFLPELEPARNCTQPKIHFLPVLAHSFETVAALEWLLAGLTGSTATTSHNELPVAVQTYPALRRELPFAERLSSLFAAQEGGGQRRLALLKLAALLHDNAKPQTKVVYPDGKVSFYEHQIIGAKVAARVLRRLRFSRQDATYVELVVREHMRPGQLRSSDTLTMRAMVRLFRDLGDSLPDLLLHELADHLAVRGPTLEVAGWNAHLAWVEALLAVYYQPQRERQAPLVDGHEVMQAVGLAPGPQVGALLREVGEAQAVGEVQTREEALALVRRILNDAV